MSSGRSHVAAIEIQNRIEITEYFEWTLCVRHKIIILFSERRLVEELGDLRLKSLRFSAHCIICWMHSLRLVPVSCSNAASSWQERVCDCARPLLEVGATYSSESTQAHIKRTPPTVRHGRQLRSYWGETSRWLLTSTLEANRAGCANIGDLMSRNTDPEQKITSERDSIRAMHLGILFEYDFSVIREIHEHAHQVLRILNFWVNSYIFNDVVIVFTHCCAGDFVNRIGMDFDGDRPRIAANSSMSGVAAKAINWGIVQQWMQFILTNGRFWRSTFCILLLASPRIFVVNEDVGKVIEWSNQNFLITSFCFGA